MAQCNPRKGIQGKGEWGKGKFYRSIGLKEEEGGLGGKEWKHKEKESIKHREKRPNIKRDTERALAFQKL